MGPLHADRLTPRHTIQPPARRPSRTTSKGAGSSRSRSWASPSARRHGPVSHPPVRSLNAQLVAPSRSIPPSRCRRRDRVGGRLCLHRVLHFGASRSATERHAHRRSVGPPGAAAQVQRQLSQAIPGGFDVVRYTTRPAARNAVREQDIAAAFVPGPGDPSLIIAGADGANVTNVLHAAFGAAAAARHQHLDVSDLAPLPSHDARGISAFFVVAGTTLGSLIFAVILFFAGGHALAGDARGCGSRSSPASPSPPFCSWRSRPTSSPTASATAFQHHQHRRAAHSRRARHDGAHPPARLPRRDTQLALRNALQPARAPAARSAPSGPDFYRDAAPVTTDHAALLALEAGVYFSPRHRRTADDPGRLGRRRTPRPIAATPSAATRRPHPRPLRRSTRPGI